MSATYGQLWTDQLLDDRIVEAQKRIWYLALRDYSADTIRAALIRITQTLRYPPRPCEVLEQVKLIHRREKDQLAYQKMEERSLLPSPKRMPNTREFHVGRLEMWQKLGNPKKIQEAQDALSRLDMQKT